MSDTLVVSNEVQILLSTASSETVLIDGGDVAVTVVESVEEKTLVSEKQNTTLIVSEGSQFHIL